LLFTLGFIRWACDEQDPVDSLITSINSYNIYIKI
jgi:hypothetical protein